MGELIGEYDVLISGLLNKLNVRFAPSEEGHEDVSGIQELAALHKEFGIFSEKHSFRSCVAVLNLAGSENWELKKRWYKLLDSLTKIPSDKEGQSGNDRIISTLKDNLESKTPVPVYFTSHDSRQDRRVLVKTDDSPVFYLTRKFITISLPMKPRP